MQFTSQQQALIHLPTQGKTFLRGQAGTGKTAVGVHRLLALLNQGIPAASILVLTPQRTLSVPYQNALTQKTDLHGPPVTLLTLSGLARRMVALYWPILNDLAGFHNPNQPPSFLTLESSQYFMAHLVGPLFDEGLFSSIAIERNRIYSQIIDNLNKSAIVGFPHIEISDRLKSAWIGDISQLNIYDDVQHCINLFREFCLENNLLDYSLQIELFRNLIWPSQICRQNLFGTFKHLIYDNCEEDPPFVHQIIAEWLPEFDSALLIYDEGGGYRRFLGADPESATSLAVSCDHVQVLEESFTTSPNLKTLSEAIRKFRTATPTRQSPAPLNLDILHQTLIVPDEDLHFYPQMLDWVIAQAEELIDAGTSPSQIVILAPFMSDMLRFSLTNRLADAGIPSYSHRPSRALRDEPAAQAVLTLTALANPKWHMQPTRFKLAYAFMHVIEGLDLVRAQLLVDQVYQKDQGDNLLLPFDTLAAIYRERISYRLGEPYETLRLWLQNTNTEDALDIFLSRLFGEVLSQPGFRFHRDLDAGRIIANLIESVRKFRWAMGNTSPSPKFILGREYLQMVADGVIAAQYLGSWMQSQQDAIFIAPAYTFLMQNKPVDYQFWLDISSSGWYERLEQPLTHPYVLSMNWSFGKKWTSEQEFEVSQANLERLMTGLIARCRKQIFLGISNFNESGSDERGLLMKRIQSLFHQALQGQDYD